MSTFAPLTAPSPRGRLMFPDEVAVLVFHVFHGRVSPEWVRRTVAPESKVRLGHSTVAWYEADVQAWLETRRGA